MNTSESKKEIPEGKTSAAELQVLGWELVRQAKQGRLFRHVETRQMLRLSHQGFCTEI